MNDGKNMKEYRVIVYSKNNLVYAKDVRSKDKGRAITNVLTNLYRGDLDFVEALNLPIVNKWICYRGCTWETRPEGLYPEDTPVSCPNCKSKDVEKYEED